MSEEKKLTDEELIKALECCAMISVNPCLRGECIDCPYFQKHIDCVEGKRSERDFIDLIHRLQSENEDLKAKQKCHLELIDDKNEEICKQKAEIERLKKRHGVALLRNDDLDLENYELKKQVEQMKSDITTAIKNYKKEMPKALKEVEKKIEEVQQQAVKDTAKEICLKIIKGQLQPIKEKWVEWFKKEYGVEVE